MIVGGEGEEGRAVSCKQGRQSECLYSMQMQSFLGQPAGETRA